MTVLHLQFPSSASDVRAALDRILQEDTANQMPEGLRDTLQIVLSEVLNNVVEHAYASTSGLIEMTVRAETDGVACTVSDTGRQMPGHILSPHAPAFPDIGEDLPEGGFGWGLIRTLTRNLRYQRINGRNELRFLVPFETIS